jgi:hypothetical protein
MIAHIGVWPVFTRILMMYCWASSLILSPALRGKMGFIHIKPSSDSNQRLHSNSKDLDHKGVCEEKKAMKKW